MLKLYRNQEDFYTAAHKGEEAGLDEAVDKPEDGVIVHGLFMEAMRWDDKDMIVVDSLPGEMTPVSTVHTTARNINSQQKKVQWQLGYPKLISRVGGQKRSIDLIIGNLCHA